MLTILKESQGTAVALPDRRIQEVAALLATQRAFCFT